MATTYFYLKDDKVCGPEPLDKLLTRWANGDLPNDTQVCPEGSESWQDLATFTDSQEAKDALNALSRKVPPTQPAPVKEVPPPVSVREYQVVPFVAVIALDKGADAAADQLQKLIRGYARHGWEYVRMERVETYIQGNDGCFGLGATPPRTTVYSMVVFQR